LIHARVRVGAIKKVLVSTDLPDREPHNSRLFVDLAENVHIHFREIRLMFSVDEFFEFMDILTGSAQEVRRYLRRHPEYRENECFDTLLVAGGPKQQLVPLRKSPLPHESQYFPRRLQIELQEEHVIDSIHLHYRDYRLVMNIESYHAFAAGVQTALAKLEEHLACESYVEGQHPFRQRVADARFSGMKITPLDRLMWWLRKQLGMWG
jgi:hypothetical protein